MKKVLSISCIVILALVTSDVFAQRKGQGNRFGQRQNRGRIGQFNQQSGKSEEQQFKGMIDSIPKGVLSPTDIEGLKLMREEEKLAHDVYTFLYKKWSIRAFGNIRSAESRHMLAVKFLLDRYQIPDPVKDLPVGKFQSKKLQTLYHKLTQQGSLSPANAIQTGIYIEELDIADLQKLIKDTDQKDLIFVYENLLKGSRNHLRAFVRLSKKYNVSYTPEFLSQKEFNQIANSPQERGPAGKGKGPG